MACSTARIACCAWLHANQRGELPAKKQRGTKEGEAMCGGIIPSQRYAWPHFGRFEEGGQQGNIALMRPTGCRSASEPLTSAALHAALRHTPAAASPAPSPSHFHWPELRLFAVPPW